MKHIDNSHVVRTLDGTGTFKIGGEDGRDAYPGDLISYVLFGLPMRELTMGDATHGKRVIAALNGKEIELEDADYSWLERMVDQYAPKVLGINAALLEQAIRPLDGDRPQRRRAAREK